MVLSTHLLIHRRLAHLPIQRVQLIGSLDICAAAAAAAATICASVTWSQFVLVLHRLSRHADTDDDDVDAVVIVAIAASTPDFRESEREKNNRTNRRTFCFDIIACMLSTCKKDKIIRTKYMNGSVCAVGIIEVQHKSIWMRCI